MEKQKIKTAFQFAKNILTTGAVSETSKEVEIEICSRLPKGDNLTIIEFGLGHGNITREILKNISPTSRLYSFEINEDFCSHVGQHLIDERFTIINDSAENLSKHINRPVDAIVSSLPFTFIAKEKMDAILDGAYQAMKDDAYFSQILYSKIYVKKFKSVFDEFELIRTTNFPAGFVHHCRKV